MNSFNAQYLVKCINLCTFVPDYPKPKAGVFYTEHLALCLRGGDGIAKAQKQNEKSTVNNCAGMRNGNNRHVGRRQEADGSGYRYR